MNPLFKAIVVFLLLFSTELHSQANSISKDNFRAELILLKSQLENHHACLYVYRTAQDIDSVIDSIIDELPDHISILEAYHHVSFLASYIQDGHALIYPSNQILNQFYADGPLFPYDLFYDGKQLNIVADYSSENEIPLGAEIISINDKTVDEMFDFMIPRLPRDGNNMQYPTHIFYKFFPAYYSFFYGFADNFKIEYLDENNKSKTKIVAGQARNKIKAVKEKLKLEPKEAIYVEFDDQNKIAILNIKTFDKKVLKNDFNQKFRKEIKAAFKLINDSKIDKLVIDLRDNQGGDLSHGAYLIKHISQKRLKLLHSLQALKIDKKTKQRKLKKEVNLFSHQLSPKTNRFKGKVYLLTNGGSFSCSAIVANAFKRENLGIIIGEETGGSSSINGGSPNKIVTLPYSKILVTIPKTQFILNDPKSIYGNGVIPDIKVTDHYSRYLGEPDLLLQEVIKN